MYKILSLDGGGLRGLYTIKVLQEIEKKYNVNITEYFDLIIGSSTGSLIACLLSLGYNSFQIEEIYLNSYEKIFNINNGYNNILFKNKYNLYNLESEISKIIDKYDYENFKTNLIIPTLDLKKEKMKLIISKKEILKDKEKRFPLKKALISSCSAPGYFNPSIIDDKIYIDSSVYSNDLSIFSLIYALDNNFKIEDIKIFSIGTGFTEINNNVENYSVKSLKDKLGLNGFVGDIISKYLNINDNEHNLISISEGIFLSNMKVNTSVTFNILKNLLSKKNYIKVNKKIENIPLDTFPNELLENIQDNLKEYEEDINLFFYDRKSILKKIFLKLSNIFKKLGGE